MKPITLFMYKLNGVLKWYPHQKPFYDSFLKTINEEKDDVVEVRFKKQRRKKTAEQLGYWFSTVLLVVKGALIEAGNDTLFDITVGDLSVGVETTTETTDLLLKTLFKAHTSSDKLPLKRDMTTDEMSKLIDFTIRWTAENLGVNIPAPLPKRRRSPIGTTTLHSLRKPR